MSNTGDEGEDYLDMSVGEANGRALDLVAQLIQELQPGSMVNKFVLVVETADEEDRWYSAFVAPGQKRWDSMGLLSYAQAVEFKFTVTVGPGEGPDDCDI